MKGYTPSSFADDNFGTLQTRSRITASSSSSSRAQP